MSKFIIILTCLVGLGLVAGARDLTAPPLKIDGAKVSTQAEAKRLAFDGYVKKMQASVLATESVRDIAIIKLGYDVTDFAAKGEKLWEARVKTLEDELRAIIWINPNTEKVHFVVGPWGSEERK